MSSQNISEYKCPKCGAPEGSKHYGSCSLAGHEVSLAYSPPDYSKLEAWLGKHLKFLQEQSPKAYAVIGLGADGVVYAVGADHDKAYAAYKKRFGSTPPQGRHILGQQLGGGADENTPIPGSCGRAADEPRR